MGKLMLSKKKGIITGVISFMCIVAAFIIGRGIIKSNAGAAKQAVFTSEGKYEVTLNQNSAWKQDKQFGYVFEVILKNTSDNVMDGWNMDVTFPGDAKVTQLWCGEHTGSGNKISVTPLAYNKKVDKGASVSFGFICYSGSEFGADGVKITCNGANADSSSDTPADTFETKTPETPIATQKPAEDSKVTQAPAEDTKETKAPAPVIEPAEDTKSESGTPVANHGKLSLKGTNIVDSKGKTYVLKGVSTHGIAWFGQYVNKDAFKTMRDDWGINVIRLAMYTDPNAGYTEKMQDLVDEGVKYATELGLYVIIDWHILSDGNPNTYKSKAITYFNKVSSKYKNYDNVIYEICNEPNGDVTWARDIKPYAQDVISTIRKNDSDAIIVVGSSTWSQDVNIVAEDPIKGYDNIMYTLHFYAATHKDDLRNRMVAAIKSGLPIFVTEFGICDASGNGAIDYAEANKWIEVMKQNNVSFAIWNLSNKNEASALINSSVTKTSGWSKSELSDEGKWFVEMMGK